MNQIEHVSLDREIKIIDYPFQQIRHSIVLEGQCVSATAGLSSTWMVEVFPQLSVIPDLLVVYLLPSFDIILFFE